MPNISAEQENSKEFNIVKPKFLLLMFVLVVLTAFLAPVCYSEQKGDVESEVCDLQTTEQDLQLNIDKAPESSSMVFEVADAVSKGITKLSHFVYYNKQRVQSIDDEEHYFTSSVSVCNHQWCEENIDAGCESSGFLNHFCTLCGYVEVTYFPAIGHKWGNWLTIKEPSYTEAGIKERKCPVCEKTEQKSIPKLVKASPVYYSDLCTMKDLTLAAYSDVDVADLFVKTAEYNSFGKKSVVNYYSANTMDDMIAVVMYGINNKVADVYTRCIVSDDLGNHVLSFLGEHSILGYTGSLMYFNTTPPAVQWGFMGNLYEECFLYVCSWADGVIDGLNIDRNTTQMEAIGLINDYIGDFLMYSYEYEQHEVLVALSDRLAVCDVYATLFQILCQKCGIKCYYVSDSERRHAYNYVVFSDGSIRYFDTTWNDPLCRCSDGVLREIENADISKNKKLSLRREYFDLKYEDYIRKIDSALS